MVTLKVTDRFETKEIKMTPRDLAKVRQAKWHHKLYTQMASEISSEIERGTGQKWVKVFTTITDYICDDDEKLLVEVKYD